MPPRQPTRRASLINGEFVKELNDLKPGLGTALITELNRRFSQLNSRMSSQVGERGTVAVAKQPGVSDIGLHLNDQTLRGVAFPRDGNDAINLDYLRSFLTCDFFAQMFEDCVDLPEQVARIIPGESDFFFSVANIQEIYVYQNSQFILCHDIQLTGFPSQPLHNLGIIETPPLVNNAPLHLRGTYDPTTSGRQVATKMLPHESLHVIYGGATQEIVGGFGHARTATLFNTISWPSPDSLPFVEQQIVFYVDGAPGDPGVTIGGMAGAAAYRNGQVVVFQQGNGSILTGEIHTNERIHYYEGTIPAFHVGVFDSFIQDGIPTGTIEAVTIDQNGIAYAIYNKGDDPGALGTLYKLISWPIRGAPTDRQVIDTGVPNTAGGGGGSMVIQASGNRLHVLHPKYTNPPSAAVNHHWKIYDISTPGHPILRSDKVSPCNQWIGMSIEGNCVMLTERTAGFTAPPTATLWDATNAANPQLIGGCVQHSIPGFQSQNLSTHFLRNSRGYYIAANRLVIQDFVGHGISCP